MNEENSEYLVKTYPDLFEYCKWFECGNGWFKIINDVAKKITSLPNWKELSCRASQVKEKFGTLSFYMDTETDEISEIIREAEKLSAKTCEICGEPGSFRGNMWFYTNCDKCWEKKDR